MKDYKIILQSQDKTKVHTIDLFGDIDIHIIFNIADIRTPESIKTNYTKEFILPASKANNKFFEGLLYNGYFPTNYNPNLKVNCQLMSDDNIVIDGYMQITDIIKNENDLDSYKVIIYGELASIFNDTNNMYLRDLDFSEFNHKWTYDNIKNSWDTSILRNNISTPFLLGRGYVYPFEHRGQSNEDDSSGLDYMNVENFFPSIYVKTIWDKVFQYSNKTYKSDFLNSDRFKKLILPYNKAHMYLSDEDLSEREFQATKNTDQLAATLDPTIVSTVGPILISFQNEVDPFDLWLSQNTFKTKHKQNTKIASILKLRITYHANVSSGAQWKIAGSNLPCMITLKNMTTGNVVATQNVTLAHTTGVILGPDYNLDLDVNFTYTATLEKNHSYQIFISIKMPTGDYASKFITNTGAAVGGYVKCYVRTDSTILASVVQKWLFEDDNIIIGNTLPDNLKIKDFLISINKMFNLYWLPNDDGGFDIEPRDNLYDNPKRRILDWTYKTDRNQEIIISPLQEINNKEYNFHYTSDDDYYNKLYTETNKAIYGERKIEVMNDFVTETNEIVPSFSPTPLISYKNSNRIVNSYVTLNGLAFETFEGNIRISIYGGIKSSDTTWKFKYAGNATGTNYNVYPYAGHFDDPFNPIYDINYGKCNDYYYDWLQTTSSNLYNDYWKNTIQDIIAIDSHIWKGKLYLKEFDIIELNLFDTIQMDNVYYKINKIDYNPLTEIADVELFKATTFAVSSNSLSVHQAPIITTNGNGTNVNGGWIKFNSPWIFEKYTGLKPYGIGNDWTNWTVHTELGAAEMGKLYNSKEINQRNNIQGNSFGIGIETKRAVNGNSVIEFDKFIETAGMNNYIAPNVISVKVVGNNNQVSTGVRNISVVGNNNFIESGVYNTSVIGDNLYVTKSNSVYAGGIIIENGYISEEFNYINGSVNEIQNPFNSAVNANLIKGGKNSVQGIGGVTKINRIGGGVDSSLAPFDTRS
jgi:hypothetical protein